MVSTVRDKSCGTY